MFSKQRIPRVTKFAKFSFYAILFDMLTKRKKQKAISEAKISEKDTGSTGVQISLLSKKIDELAKHLKKHQKDNSSRKGLLQMVADRRKLVKYLQAKDVKKYNALAKKLDLKLAK